MTSYEFCISENDLANLSEFKGKSQDDAEEIVLMALTDEILKRYTSFIRVKQNITPSSSHTRRLLKNNLFFISSQAEHGTLVIMLTPRWSSYSPNWKKNYQARWVDTYRAAILQCLTKYLPNCEIQTNIKNKEPIACLE